jgi:hypothetical protein
MGCGREWIANMTKEEEITHERERLVKERLFEYEKKKEKEEFEEFKRWKRGEFTRTPQPDDILVINGIPYKKV